MIWLSFIQVIKISQAEVLEFLENHKGKWFTTRQLSEKIGINMGSCTGNITRLVRSRLISRRESGKRYCYEYKHKGKNEEY